MSPLDNYHFLKLAAIDLEIGGVRSLCSSQATQKDVSTLQLIGISRLLRKQKRSLWHAQWLDIYWYGIPRVSRTGGIPTGNLIAVAEGRLDNSPWVQAWRNSYPKGLIWGEKVQA